MCENQFRVKRNARATSLTYFYVLNMTLSRELLTNLYSDLTLCTTLVTFRIVHIQNSWKCQDNVETALWSFVLTFFQRRTPTLYQSCATLKIRLWIFVRFQRRINVILTLQDVEATYRTLKCWLGVYSGILKRIHYYWGILRCG